MTCSLGLGFCAALTAAAASLAACAGAAAAGTPGSCVTCGGWATAPAGMRLMRTASSPSLISISAMPDSSSSSISFLIFRMSMPGLPPRRIDDPGTAAVSGLADEPQRCGAYRRFIAECTEPADHAERNVGKIRVPPERLAGMRIGQMHLDKRQPAREHRITQCDARMRERTGVEDEEGDAFAACPVDALDQLVLRVALKSDQLVPGLACDLRGTLLYRLQGVRPIHGRLPSPEQIEVRAVQQQHAGHDPRLLDLIFAQRPA